MRTKERRLVLGDNTSAFMRRIGLHVTGGARGDIGRLRGQMERLFLSTVVCRYDDPSEGRAAANRYDVADGYQLWWDAPESVKPDETRRVHALCATSSMGWLIHAMVGSCGGCGRRVKRVGLAA